MERNRSEKDVVIKDGNVRRSRYSDTILVGRCPAMPTKQCQVTSCRLPPKSIPQGHNQSPVTAYAMGVRHRPDVSVDISS